MCGIAIHLVGSGRAAPLDLARLHHRGPDSRGEWTSEDARAWLGATRLAIVDLSPTGEQPMRDPATGNVVVQNGEIYNHRALREQLGADVNWRGTSDTETILQGYARWGRGVLDRMKGMFAFAIYDQARGQLFMARDRLGIKPLYYVADENGFRAASETKALIDSPPHISPQSISAYLRWGACPENEILFSAIKVLPAGHAMTIDAQGKIEMWKYWPARPAFVSSSTGVVKNVRRKIENAVEEHLLSDVPVASFLSGGIDSSVVSAIAAQRLEKKLQTFSVGFDLAEFDETAIAQRVADRYHANHERIQLSEAEVIRSVQEAVEKFDLPSVDAINTYIVSRAVAGRGVKVALSGLGGDELFGGYATFRDVPKLKLISKLPRPLRRLLGSAGNFGARLADVPENAGAIELARWRRQFFTQRMLKRAGLPNGTAPFDAILDLPDDHARISWAELGGYMREMLLRDADQMSMAVSLELRVPFLDHELVEYVLGLPKIEKQRFGAGKGLLVEACRDLLPPEVYERPKRGFVLPMRNWMLGPLAAFVEEGKRETIARELLPRAFVNEIADGFRAGRLHWTRLWCIVVLGQFAKRRQLYGRAHENPALHSHA